MKPYRNVENIQYEDKSQKPLLWSDIHFSDDLDKSYWRDSESKAVCFRICKNLKLIT